MKKLGCTSLVLGIGALALPIFGLQFKMINLISSPDIPVQIIAIILIVAGAVMIFISRVLC